jgi:predicted enzyme related to lactoylglutathione lyase
MPRMREESTMGEDMGPAGHYWLASEGETQVRGAMAKPAGMPKPSAWSSCVPVNDVDDAAVVAAAPGPFPPPPRG